MKEGVSIQPLSDLIEWLIICNLEIVKEKGMDYGDIRGPMGANPFGNSATNQLNLQECL